MTDHEIQVKTTTQIALNPNLYLAKNQNIINKIIWNMGEQGLVELNLTLGHAYSLSEKEKWFIPSIH